MKLTLVLCLIVLCAIVIVIESKSSYRIRVGRRRRSERVYVARDGLAIRSRRRVWRFNRKTGKYHLVWRKINKMYACSLNHNGQVRHRKCPRRWMTCKGHKLRVVINGTPAYYTFCDYYFPTKPDYIKKAIRKACIRATKLKLRTRACRGNRVCGGGPITVKYHGRPLSLKFCVKKGAVFDPLTVWGNNLRRFRRRRRRRTTGVKAEQP